MLKLIGLHKAFGSDPVLNGVSFDLSPGQIVGLIGRSGSGKTVLARSIVGLTNSDAGTLEFAGKSYILPHDLKEAWEPIRQRIGYVFQARSLPPYRTLVELVSEGPRYVLRMPKHESIELAASLLNEFDLGSHRHKYANEISGGQLARVCLARAMAMSPEYLICDEVTANLDPIASAAVGQYLLRARERGLGLVIISHQIGFIREYADRLDFLHDGQIQCRGRPKNLFEAPQDSDLEAFLKADSISF